VLRLYDKMAKSSRPFSVTPRRHKPAPAAAKANGHGHAKKGPKIVPTAAE
jgi:hypothetical protein